MAVQIVDSRYFRRSASQRPSVDAGLALLDSVVGANRSAAAAADACVRIDVVDITLRDCLNGTYGLACATSDTSVCNYVSHDFLF